MFVGAVHLEVGSEPIGETEAGAADGALDRRRRSLRQRPKRHQSRPVEESSDEVLQGLVLEPPVGRPAVLEAANAPTETALRGPVAEPKEVVVSVAGQHGTEALIRPRYGDFYRERRLDAFHRVGRNPLDPGARRASRRSRQSKATTGLFGDEHESVRSTSPNAHFAVGSAGCQHATVALDGRDGLTARSAGQALGRAPRGADDAELGGGSHDDCITRDSYQVHQAAVGRPNLRSLEANAAVGRALDESGTEPGHGRASSFRGASPSAEAIRDQVVDVDAILAADGEVSGPEGRVDRAGRSVDRFPVERCRFSGRAQSGASAVGFADEEQRAAGRTGPGPGEARHGRPPCGPLLTEVEGVSPICVVGALGPEAELDDADAVVGAQAQAAVEAPGQARDAPRRRGPQRELSHSRGG